jgi:hypothetical protein
MSQAQLEREVARSTGESVGFIRSMGFSELNIPRPQHPRRFGRQAAIRLHKAPNNEPADQVLRRAA